MVMAIIAFVFQRLGLISNSNKPIPKKPSFSVQEQTTLEKAFSADETQFPVMVDNIAAKCYHVQKLYISLIIVPIQKWIVIMTVFHVKTIHGFNVAK
jgi:hypothetical protein